MKIALAPGHSQSFQGVVKNGYREYSECAKIVEQMAPKLTAQGHIVVVVEGTLKDKVDKINEITPDIALEVHLGNSHHPRISGSRAFFSQNVRQSQYLAEFVLEGVVRTLGTRNNGSWIGWFKKISPTLVKSGKAPADWKPKIDLFLSKTHCPSILIEPFYLSSVADVNQFLTMRRHDFVAEAIVNGIQLYVNSNLFADVEAA